MSGEIPGFISRQVVDARHFFADLSPPPRSRQVVVCGGYEVCLPDYHIHREAFPWYSIEIVVGGAGRLRLGRGNFQPLRAGSVYSYGPGARHEIAVDPNNPLTKYFVDFTGSDARRILRQAHLLPYGIRHCHAIKEPADIMELMIRNGSIQSLHSPAICARLLEVLCLKFAEMPTQINGQTGRAYETYLRCRTELHRRFLSIGNMEELAETCQIDPAYLCRLFQQFDQQSPYQLLVSMKMNHAAAALMRSGRLVKQVAREVGFEDAYHFSRVFKRCHGVSPQVFAQR